MGTRATGHNSPIYALCALPDSLFQNSKKDEGCFIAVLCCINVITSRTLKVIWNVYPVLCSCPYPACYLWEFNNNCAQSVGRTGEDNFPQLFTPFCSSGLLQELLRIWNFLWILRKTYCYCYACHVSSLQSTSCLEFREIFKKIKEPAQENNFLVAKWQD